MAIHVYSPASAATQRGRAGRTIAEMRIIPAKTGAIIEHHYANADGVPAGAVDRFTHPSIEGVHDHLDNHLAPLMPAESSTDTSAGTGTPRGSRA